MELIKTFIDVNSTETHQIYANQDEEFGIGFQGLIGNTIVNLKASELTLKTNDTHGYSFNSSKWDQNGYAVFAFPSFKEKIIGVYATEDQTSFSFNLTINKSECNQAGKIYNITSQSSGTPTPPMASYGMEWSAKTYTNTPNFSNSIWYYVGTDDEVVDNASINDFTHVEPYTTMPDASAMMSGSLATIAPTDTPQRLLIPAKAGSKYGVVDFNPGLAGQTITEDMFVNLGNTSVNVNIFVCRQEPVYGRMAIAQAIHIDAINKTINNAIKLSLISDASRSEINSNKMVFGRGEGQIVIDADTTTASNSKIKIAGNLVATKNYVDGLIGTVLTEAM